MDKLLVSVLSDGMVKELYWADNTDEVRPIRALHRGCAVEIMRIMYEEEVPPVNIKRSVIRCDRIVNRSDSRQVRCIETDRIYDSVLACSEEIGVTRWSVYKSIRGGMSVNGLHYEYND